MNETNTDRARTRGGEGAVKGHSGSDWGSGTLPMIHFTVNGRNLGPGRALGGHPPHTVLVVGYGPPAYSSRFLMIFDHFAYFLDLPRGASEVL